MAVLLWDVRCRCQEVVRGMRLGEEMTCPSCGACLIVWCVGERAQVDVVEESWYDSGRRRPAEIVRVRKVRAR